MWKEAIAESKRECKVGVVGQNPVSWNLVVLSDISFNLLPDMLS